MATDLVQLRWQHLRTVESLQVLENENLKLRKEAEQLRKIPVVAPVSHEDTVEKIKLRKHCHELKAFVFRLQADVMKIRLSTVQELNSGLHEKQLLSQSFDHLVKIMKGRESVTDALVQEKIQLSKQLNELRQQGSNTSNSLLKEVAKLKSLNNELQEKAAEGRSLQSTMTDEILSLKTGMIDLQKKLSDKQEALEKSNTECRTLGERVVQKELEGIRNVEEAYRQKQEMQDYYEKILDQLGFENNYLRNTCSEQEAQIARLTNSLIGNKSHFAKYVEVKTENLTLQQKLESIAKNKKSAVAGSRVNGLGAAVSIGTTDQSYTSRLAASHTEQLSATLAAAAHSTSQGNQIVSSAPNGFAAAVGVNEHASSHTVATTVAAAASESNSGNTALLLPAHQHRAVASRLAAAGISATHSPSRSTKRAEQISAAAGNERTNFFNSSPQTSPRYQMNISGLTQRQQALQDEISSATGALSSDATKETIRTIRERTALLATAAAGPTSRKSLRFDDNIIEDGGQVRISLSANSNKGNNGSSTAVAAASLSVDGRISSKVSDFLDEKRRNRSSFGEVETRKNSSIGSAATSYSSYTTNATDHPSSNRMNSTRQSSSAKTAGLTTTGAARTGEVRNIGRQDGSYSTSRSEKEVTAPIGSKLKI